MFFFAFIVFESSVDSPPSVSPPCPFHDCGPLEIAVLALFRSAFCFSGSGSGQEVRQTSAQLWGGPAALPQVVFLLLFLLRLILPLPCGPFFVSLCVTVLFLLLPLLFLFVLLSFTVTCPAQVQILWIDPQSPLSVLKSVAWCLIKYQSFSYTESVVEP